MDKIGGEGPHGQFYTREDWGKADQPSIWGQGIPSNLSETIDWVVVEKGTPWGADDDTDIEYMYQFLMHQHGVSVLSAEQIRNGWLTHIYSDDSTPFTNTEGKKENYLWVSNQQAHDLMRLRGMLPPLTGLPENNSHFDMIDAQLSTEIFGLFAPAHPDLGLELAKLPIRTVAYGEAVLAAEFYVVMHSLAAKPWAGSSIKERLFAMAKEARKHLPDESYTAHMYDDIWQGYQLGLPWEQVRDTLYQTYQVEGQHGYDISSRDLYCNGCFASGINFAASLVSLFYGEGDFKETIKLAVLMGWDSDNPAATWGGLLGFMYGYEKIQSMFDRELSTEFNIHRTRGGFPNNGLDNFDNMASTGVKVIDQVMTEKLNAVIDKPVDSWLIPISTSLRKQTD
jgi:hypothetical protein